MVTAILLAFAVLVGLGIGHGVWRSTQTSSNSASNGSGGVSNPFGGGSGGSSGGGSAGSGTPNINVDQVAAEVDPSLVDIATTLIDGEAFGTGIVLSSDGYVLTNNHVIIGAQSIKVTDIGNQRTYTAAVVGYDRTHDVALIKLQNASGLRAAKLGKSSSVRTNQAVVGIGNAGGAGGVPSTAPGTVTQLNQSITAEDQSTGSTEQLSGLIETDADIQPGDSGGALVDSSGDVIGMDTAASQGFSFQSSGNQGFAIPIDTATSIASQIKAGDSTSSIHIGATAFLGVEIDVQSQQSQSQSQTGAVVQSPVSNGPAAKAGIGDNSVIIGLGNSSVNSANDLTNLIGKYRPGDAVKVTWVDASGQTHSATVTLSSGPPA